MAEIIPNSLQYPNYYVDELMHLLTPTENTVLLFAAREILGWDGHRATRKARVSLSVFADGYTDQRGERRSYGTGIGRHTVIQCLDNLVRFKVLIKHDITNEGTEYEINLDPHTIDLAAMEERRAEFEQSSKEKMKAALAISNGGGRCNRRPDDGGSRLHRLPAVGSTDHRASVAPTQLNKETNETKNILCADAPRAETGEPLETAELPEGEMEGGNEPVIENGVIVIAIPEKKGVGVSKKATPREAGRPPASPPARRSALMAQGLSDQQAMVSALARVTKQDARVAGQKLAPHASKLLKAGYTPEQLLAAYLPGGWWYRHDFRGKQGKLPNVAFINSTILQATENINPERGNKSEPGVERVESMEERQSRELDEQNEGLAQQLNIMGQDVAIKILGRMAPEMRRVVLGKMTPDQRRKFEGIAVSIGEGT